MVEEYVMEGTVRRKAVKVICNYCGNTFLKVKKNLTEKNYCCIEHAHLGSRERINLKCAYCDVTIAKRASTIKNSKTGLFFCCREHKDLGQRISSNLFLPSNYKQGESVYRKIAFRYYTHKCEACGWNLYKELLEVHHIDSNRKNNKIENLIILCPTCHRGLTLKVAILSKERQWIYIG